jgi:hypothetical protein
MGRRTTTLMTLALALVVVVGASAQAKGPESVTLSGPGIDKPIELISVSKSFDTYENDAPVTLIGLIGLGSGSLPIAIAPPENPGPAYTLTWVNMGPPSEPIESRTIHQYVYVDAVGGPLIHTPEQIGLDGWGAEVVGWFEAPEEIGPTIEEVIAWSTSDEATALQPVTEPPTHTPTAPTSKGALPPIWFGLAALVGIGGFAVWRVRHQT